MSGHVSVLALNLLIVYRLILAISVAYGERANLAIVRAWIYEHPYCTDGDIWLFVFLRTNVLIVKSLWIKVPATCPECKRQQSQREWV